MKLSDFDYELPAELIARHPAADRPSARLLYVNRKGRPLAHRRFHDLENLLKPGDLLVLNNTKVIPARILGRRETGGKVEALLLRNAGGNRWQALLRPSGRIKKGTRIFFGENGERAEALVVNDPGSGSGERCLEFLGADVRALLEKIGHMPLPPYLQRPDRSEDREDYQTVFAAEEGAVAAPTAGLHFDRPLLQKLSAAGIELAYVTLHVGFGTFQSVTQEDMTRHEIHAETYEMSGEAARRINRACREKRRVIACGTTAMRVLETAAAARGEVRAASGETRLFVYPPYDFKIASGLITNFHWPRSTLLLLVSAFLQAGGFYAPSALLDIYQEAIREKYRFYSYGDAMLVI